MSEDLVWVNSPAHIIKHMWYIYQAQSSGSFSNVVAYTVQRRDHDIVKRLNNIQIMRESVKDWLSSSSSRTTYLQFIIYSLLWSCTIYITIRGVKLCLHTCTVVVYTARLIYYHTHQIPNIEWNNQLYNYKWAAVEYWDERVQCKLSHNKSKVH